MASIFSPFLNTGQMFAVFHMAGIVLDSYAILNMTVSIGAILPSVVCRRAHVLFMLFVFVWFFFTFSCL